MNEVLEKINKFGQQLAQPLSIEETYKIIVKGAMNLASAQYGSILLWKEGVLERVYASTPEMYSTHVRKKGYTMRASLNPEPSYISIDKVKKIHPALTNLHIRCIVYIPLFYTKKSIGVISLDSRSKDSYTSSELQILKLYGGYASLALKKMEMYSETKQALEIRDFFISIAAHELRTPLTAINGYVQLLQKKLPPNSSDESRWVEKLVHETSRLTVLTKELLESNRIRAGVAEYILKEYELSEIMLRTISRLQYHYPQKNIMVANKLSSHNDRVIADYDKLTQVFYNILENAIKFSPLLDPVHVTLQQAKPYLQIDIKDTGKGITQEKLKKIIHGNFYSIDDGSEKTGMGIGLFLVKKIVEKHNGIIDIESSKKGTKVTIRLPLVNHV